MTTPVSLNDKTQLIIDALKEGRYAAEQGGFAAIAKQIHEAIFTCSEIAEHSPQALVEAMEAEKIRTGAATAWDAAVDVCIDVLKQHIGEGV